MILSLLFMSKTRSEPSRRHLIQYHMFKLSISDGLRCNFQISNSSTLWDTAPSFTAVACIFQNIHIIFRYMHRGLFSHHSCNSDLLYATSKPQKTHLMRHKGLYPAVENASCMLSSSFDDLTTGFFLFLFIFCPPQLFPTLLAATKKTRPVSFSHITHSRSRVLCVD